MIDQTDTREVLLESAKDAFQTLVFMSIEEADDQDRKIIAPAISANIAFEGYAQGCLSLCCSQACAQAITVNMLALDTNEKLSETQIYDALREITSKIMDCIKSRLKAQFSNTNFSIPSVTNGDDPQTNMDETTISASIKTSLDGKFPIKFTFSHQNTDSPPD